MDPNIALSALRKALGDLKERPADQAAAYDLADAAQALDEWLSKGGFLPDAWSNAR